MNVDHYLSELPLGGTLTELLDLRKKTFHGFCAVEVQQGGLDPLVPLTTPRGQESVRVLVMRTLEEVMEAYHSHEKTHYQEEWVDAVNFATSLLFLPHQNQAKAFLDFIHLGASLQLEDEVGQYKPASWDSIRTIFNRQFVTDTLLMKAHPLLETLRNRAWQNQVQNPHFMGSTPLIHFVYEVWFYAIEANGGWDHFCQMYKAKDAVLQFRLSTNY